MLTGFKIKKPTIIKPGIWNTYAAGAISSLTFGMCSASYVWVNPVMGELLQGAEALSESQLGWVACLLELAALVSPLPAGYLADYLGRRALLLASCPVLAITWLPLFFTRVAYVLYIVRIAQGLLMGAVCTVLPMYLAEIACSKTRGRLGVMSSLGWNFGILFEYIIGPFISYIPLICINLLFPMVVFMLFYLFHESPYFLIMKGRVKEAEEALYSFRGDANHCSEEIAAIQKSLDDDSNKESGSWKELMTTRAGLRGLFIIFFLNVTFNFSGAMSILEFCSETFRVMSGVSLASSLFTIGLGVVLTVVPVLTALTIDRWGRRPTLLISYLGSTACLLPVALYFWLHEGGPPASWVALPVLGIVLYPAFINYGAMIIAHTYQAELFPSSTRSLASALATIVGSTCATLTIQIYEPMETSHQNYITYTVYTLFAIVGLILSYFCALETSGRTFDEIQEDLTKSGNNQKNKL